MTSWIGSCGLTARFFSDGLIPGKAVILRPRCESLLVGLGNFWVLGEGKGDPSLVLRGAWSGECCLPLGGGVNS